MADGKMVVCLLQLGGAYGTMCTRGQEECQNPVVIEGGFIIDRSIESLNDLALSLVDPDTGEVTQSKGDYKTRQGVCGQPITETDMTKNIPVCHAKIRSFEFIVELLVRYLSHKKWWTPTNKTTYSKEEKQSYQAARVRLKDAL